MVVEQEMAQIYPPGAEELAEFLPETDCGDCGFKTCTEFASALLDRNVQANVCGHVEDEFARVLASIMELNTDPIPYNIMMEQHPCTLLEINVPDKTSPLLVTSNFRETVRIMKEILECTGTRAFLLPTFTHGYSVDNAIPERMFKAMEIWKAMKDNAVEQRLERPVIIIPGLAASEKNSIKQLTRCDVLPGPVSGFLAPLFILANREEFQ
jgi:CO dehydrogenase/acetyl-CoA synthase gamma subunit (corrinoid Fe-S protein)